MSALLRFARWRAREERRYRMRFDDIHEYYFWTWVHDHFE